MRLTFRVLVLLVFALGLLVDTAAARPDRDARQRMDLLYTNPTGAVNSDGYKMDVNGNFYGPGAQEVGGLFRITGNGGNGQGVIAGVQP